MKLIGPLFVICLISSISVVGQQTRPEPIPGRPPVIMTSADFENLQIPAQLDRYDKLREKDERIRLDRFVDLISADNKTVEYVIGLKEKAKDVAAPHLSSIFRFLTIEKKITANRISFVFGTNSANEVELWLVPNNKIVLPGCADCLVVAGEKLNEFLK